MLKYYIYIYAHLIKKLSWSFALMAINVINIWLEKTHLDHSWIVLSLLKMACQTKKMKKINLFSKIPLQWCDNAAENIWGQSMTFEAYIILQTAFDKRRKWQTPRQTAYPNTRAKLLKCSPSFGFCGRQWPTSHRHFMLSATAQIQKELQRLTNPGHSCEVWYLTGLKSLFY